MVSRSDCGDFQLRSRSRSWSRGRNRFNSLQNFFKKPETLSVLRELRFHLLDLEEENWHRMQKVSGCHDEDSIRKFWRRHKSLLASEVREKLLDLLKDFPAPNPNMPCEPTDIARDLGCCVLQARSSKGRGIETQNSEYSLQNHKDMISDQVRVDAFWDAIRRALASDASDSDASASAIRVLDVGSGAFCFLSRMALAAGAKEVHAVEVNHAAWNHATQLFQAEVRLSSSGAGEFCSNLEEFDQDIQESLQLVGRFPLIGREAQAKELAVNASETTYGVTLSLGKQSDRSEVKRESKLLTQCASSSLATLAGPYQLVIHEVLGHIASSEGVAETIDGLVRRGMCSSTCVFIPRAAGTLFAPTVALKPSDLENVLNAHFNGEVGIRTQVKYHARCFDSSHFLAEPQPFEWYEFGKSDCVQKRRVTFVTAKDGNFNGLHFHLLIELDEFTSIDTLRSETTWSTTYVRLIEESLWLPSGTRMVCDCETKLKCDGTNRGIRSFRVQVHIGEPWDEQEIASFSWEGCILVGIIYDKYGSLHRAKCDAFGLLLTYWIGNPLLNYLVKGESFGSSLSDVCLNIVSFIVPLAALATDFGKIMTTKMLQKVCSYRLGLVAGLLSRIRGKEVALLITEHEELDPSKSEAIIDLMDQRAVDMRKQGARVRLVDEQAKFLRAKLTMLFNSLPSHQKHEYHQLTEQMDGDPGVIRPTKVAIGVKTWGHNHHMVSMARHGVSASASSSGSLCQIRSLGFQEIKDCKDALSKAANCHETLMKVSQDPSHQSHQLLLEQLRDNLVPPEPAPPFIQFLSEEH
eukprot:s4576_g1.t1